MAASYEVSTFVQKFNQLSTSGFRANLNLSCCDGRITVNLNAELGSLMSFNYPPPPPPPLFKRVKPSQFRRRKRRNDRTKTSFNHTNVDSTFEHTATGSTLVNEEIVVPTTNAGTPKPELSINKQPSVEVSPKEW